jgi:small GTP-binding protein
MALDEHLKRELRSRSDKARAELDEFERTKVHVALIGETGAGKSSLINAIVGSKVAKTGGTGETTQQAQAVPHEEIDGLVFWDLPGCGTPNHPRETYIERQGLLRNFDVFVLVTDKRIRQGDEWLYRTLCKEHGRPFFVVRTHFDQVVDETPEAEARRLIEEDIRKQLSAGRDLALYIVALKGPSSYDLGKLVEDIVNALSGWKQDKAVMAVAAVTEDILRKKRDAAEKIVGRYALVSAANGLNPVPGLDISVDVGVLEMMAIHVVSAYGLRDDQLDYAARRNLAAGAMQAIRQIAKPATEYLAKEAIIALLKRFGTSVAAKSVSKWVPFVGQAVAAYLGW